MGHHHDTVTAVGVNRRAAENTARSDYLYEHGHNHSIYGVDSATFVRKVPPMREEVAETHVHYNHLTRQRIENVHVRQVPDLDAPPDQWLEEWTFVLHVHF